MASYELNWNYRPAYEKLFLTKISPANLNRPIKNFFEVSVTDCLNRNNLLTGDYYLNTSNSLVNADWTLQLNALRANGTSSVENINNLSGQVGVKSNGYLWSSWQQDNAPDDPYNGELHEVKYAVAIPNQLVPYTRVPEYIRTKFNTPVFVPLESGYIHTPVETAFTLEKVKFTEWSISGQSISDLDTIFDSTWADLTWIGIDGEDGSNITASDLNPTYGFAMDDGDLFMKYNTNGHLSPTSSSYGSYIYGQYVVVSYDPSAKKVMWTPTNSGLIEAVEVDELSFDGVTYDETNTLSDYLGSMGILNLPWTLLIGIDQPRKTSITVHHCTVKTVYQGVTTTTTVAGTPQEVFSDTGIFELNGIELIVNKTNLIDISTPEDYPAIYVKWNNRGIVSRGTHAYLTEVAYY